MCAELMKTIVGKKQYISLLMYNSKVIEQLYVGNSIFGTHVFHVICLTLR